MQTFVKPNVSAGAMTLPASWYFSPEIFAREEQATTPMTAKVEMCVEPVLGANEDDALACDVEYAIGSGLAQRVGPAGVKPLVPKDRLLLASIEARVPVRLPRKRGLKR